MTDGEALLRAVLADPADDAPRLVYADWLEDRGDAPMADTIRRMCRARRERVRVRPQGAPSPFWPDAPAWAGYTVRRGFVAEVAAPTPEFLAHAAAVFARHPVTRVVLSDRLGRRRSAGRGVWAVAQPGLFPDRHVWPAALFPGRPVGTPLAFRSAAASRNALSAAAVAFGRSGARLPPLAARQGGPDGSPTPDPQLR